jgi:[protein-PII] uridylyltransferase
MDLVLTPDASALAAEIDALAEGWEGSDGELRAAVLARMRSLLAEGRKAAEAELTREGHGRACAQRLSALMDTLVRVLAGFATTHVYPVDNPSRGERLALMATGGYGRGTLAPGSDIDLLFLLPYKQTPWGESVVEHVLYMLWDLGLKVGHASRNLDDCIRLARADMTIRTAVLEARPLWGDAALAEELGRRFEKEVVKGTAAAFVAAKLAERE